MLDAEIMRATGERVSRCALVGIRRLPWVGCGEWPRARGACTGGVWTGGVCTVICVSCRSGEGSLTGGPMGNLKLDENDPEGFRPVVGRAGVLGAVVMPGLRLGGRAGNAKSCAGSWMVGGKDAPPARGEGCVAERWPGDGTVAASVNVTVPPCVTRTWIRRGPVGHDLQTGRAAMPSRRPCGGCAAVVASSRRSIRAQRYDGDGPPMLVAPPVVDEGPARRDGGAAIFRNRRGMERLDRAVAAQQRRAGDLRDKGRVAGNGGPRGGSDRGQLALSLAAGRKAVVFAPRRGLTAARGRYVLEGDCALHVFAGKHGRVLPLYEYPDIRRGHGREGRRRGRRRVRRRLIGRICRASWRLACRRLPKMSATRHRSRAARCCGRACVRHATDDMVRTGTVGEPAVPS